MLKLPANPERFHIYTPESSWTDYWLYRSDSKWFITPIDNNGTSFQETFYGFETGFSCFAEALFFLELYLKKDYEYLTFLVNISREVE